MTSTQKSALCVSTTILPGRRIEISAPELREGEAVDVIIVSAHGPPDSRRHALDLIASLKGHRLFESPEAVDRYLDAERDSWGP